MIFARMSPLVHANRFYLALIVIVSIFVVAACSGALSNTAQSPSPIDEPDTTETASAQEQPVANAEDSTQAVSDSSSSIYPVDAEPSEEYKGIPVGFTAEGLPYRGDPSAPVVMVEYSDYQCPFCGRYFVQTEPALDEAYVRDGQVRVVFFDFPLESLHPNAPAAHVAANCVAEQGSARAYWEMHAALFRSVAEWQNAADPNSVFASLAEELDIDSTHFQSCLEDSSQLDIVNERVAHVGRLGFSGTPSFQFFRLADGESFQLVGAQPYDEFANLLDAVLAGDMPNQASAVESGQEDGDSGEIPYWASTEGLAPDPNRPGFNMAGDQYRGNLDAAVTVVEFSDFQCPYCRRHLEATQPVLDERFVDTGQVLWIFKHFPLTIHPQAEAAGAAAECAADQGEFWSMHEKLFDEQTQWSTSNPNPVFVDLAEQLDLDVEAFSACLEADETMQRVNSDLQAGAPFVRGTPTFIVIRNGQGSIIPGALPADRFSEIIEQVIAEASTN